MRLRNNIAKIGCHCPSGEERQIVFQLSRDRWFMHCVGLHYPKPQSLKYKQKNIYYNLEQTCVAYLEQPCFVIKLEKTLLQIEAAQLLQIRARGEHYKSELPVIAKWDSYYKFGQALLQIRAIITNWGITPVGMTNFKNNKLEKFKSQQCIRKNDRSESLTSKYEPYKN